MVGCISYKTMNNKINILIVLVSLIFGSIMGAESDEKHPNLILTSEDVRTIIPQIDDYSLFTSSFSLAKNRSDSILVETIDVPVPIDAGGGYTHEKHKQN